MMLAMTQQAPDLLTSAEVATRLGIDTSTLSRWARSGRITEHMKVRGLRGPRLFAADEVARLEASRTHG